MVPSWSSAFVWLAAFDPIGLLDDLTADTLLFFFVLASVIDGFFNFFWKLNKTFFLNTLVQIFFSLIFSLQVNHLLLQIIQNNSLQVKGVEECSFGKGRNMLSIDGSDLEMKSMLSLLDKFVVLAHLSYFYMGVVKAIEKLVLIAHGLNCVFDILKVLFVCWIGFNHLYYFVPLLWGDCESEFQES